MFEVYMYAIIFFLFGITLGSFFNVVGCRLPEGDSIIFPASHCPKCKKQLKTIDLIPILSYVFLRGKCRHCHTKISPIYPLFELGTGILFVISYLVFGMSLSLLLALSFSSILIIIMISDIRYMVIPDEVILFGGILFSLERLSMGSTLMELIIDASIPFVLLFAIKCLGDFLFKKESLGGGDLKLIFLFGLVLGWELSILAIFISAFIALPISLIILKVKKTNIIPFGPFLSIAALLLYFTNFDISWIINILVG